MSKYPAIISNGKYLVPPLFNSKSNKHNKALAKKHPDGCYIFDTDDYSDVKQTTSLVVVFNLRTKHLRSESMKCARSLGFRSDGGIEELTNDLKATADTKIDTIAMEVTPSNAPEMNLDIFQEFDGVNVHLNIQEWESENEDGKYVWITDYLSETKADSEAKRTLMPTELGDYLINDDLRNVMIRTHSSFIGLPVQFFILLGSAGSGKTDFVRRILPMYLSSFDYEFDYMFVDPTSLDEPEKMFAQKEIVTVLRPSEVVVGDKVVTIEQAQMETQYVWSRTAQMLVEDTNVPMILVINEFNRGADGDYINALVGLTGEEKSFSIGNDTYEVTRPLLVFATGNVGVEYLSADGIDAALKSRASIVNMTTPDRALWYTAGMRHLSEIKDTIIDNKDFYSGDGVWQDYNRLAKKISNIMFEMSEEVKKQDCGINISFRQMKRVIFNTLMMTYAFGHIPSLEILATQIALDTTYTLDIEQDDVIGQLNAIIEKQLS